MAWVAVGNVLADRDRWVTVGVIQSNTLLLSFAFQSGVPDRAIVGYLRERFADDIVGLRWQRIYPKVKNREVLVLPANPDFRETIYQSREIEIVMGNDAYSWSVAIFQWL